MINYIKRISNRVGIDGAIFYTLLGRMLQASGGIISIFFIVRYLSKDEQGYYYTFGSILAIQIFFELGLTNIITQFVAHEKAHLTWGNDTVLLGDEKSLSRMSSLLHFCIKWFVVISIILIIGLIISGFIFFNSYGKNEMPVDWQIPWIIISITTAGSLMMSPILAFFEGLGKVKEIAKIRLIQQLVQMTTMFSFLFFGMKLYSSPLASLLSVLIPPFLIFFSSKKKLLKNLWGSLREWKVDYKSEIFPYQWRIAISWISGYFIFQLFNPVSFATEGAEIAGQMGMTLAVLNGILSLTLSWINTKVPLFSSLIAVKDYKKLDVEFGKTVFHSSLVCLFCLIVFVLGVYGLKHYGFSIGDRFLSLYLVVLLSGCTFVNQFINALATYLRCHKQEPFFYQALGMGILVSCSTFIFGFRYGIDGIVGGYSFLTIVISLLWSVYIFKTKKKEWHDK